MAIGPNGEKVCITEPVFDPENPGNPVNPPGDGSGPGTGDGPGSGDGEGPGDGSGTTPGAGPGGGGGTGPGSGGSGSCTGDDCPDGEGDGDGDGDDDDDGGGEGEGASTDELYTKGDRTVAQVFADFSAKVQGAGFFAAAGNFFNTSIPGGGCPSLSASYSILGAQWDIDMTSVFCGAAAQVAYSVLSVGIMLAAVWVAFSIAFL
jgi:hypothetical protein